MNAIRREGAILWGVALLWLLLFAASMLYHTGGRLAPAAGRFLHLFPIRTASGPRALPRIQYRAEPTAGATSLLYTLLLVPGFWLGLDGMGIALYALVLGVVWLGLSARLLLLLGCRLGGPFSGWVAALMFLLCGPLLWGYYSGMAIGLFAFAILLTLYLYLTEDRRTPLRRLCWRWRGPRGSPWPCC